MSAHILTHFSMDTHSGKNFFHVTLNSFGNAKLFNRSENVEMDPKKLIFIVFCHCFQLIENGFGVSS